MYRLTQQPSARKITTKEASAFLELNNFPGQRALHESKARRYCELLLQGKLRPVEIAFATCEDGNRYLINGQHVCQACIWAGREMNALLTHYKCDTWADAWQIFATFDVHASRTQGQIFNAARGLFTNEDLRDVQLRVLNLCGTALACLNGTDANFKRHSVTADKTSKPLLVEQHAQDVLWVSSFSDARFMLKVGCIAAMVASRRRDPEAAEEFWRKVQSGLGFRSKAEPQKKVFDFLGKSATSNNSRNHHEVIFAVCISWWNSWRTNKPRHSVKFASMSELPKVI